MNRRASSGVQSTSMVIFMGASPTGQGALVARPASDGEDAMGERTTITSSDGPFSAYVARPAAAKAPAVVVIQEIFGVNQVMRDITDGLASQGYLAVCPDLFW